MVAEEESKKKIVVVSAGTSQQSTTTELSALIAKAASEALDAHGFQVDAEMVELRDLAREISNGITTGIVGNTLREVLDSIARADAVIAATPVYKAGASGLFSSFWNLMDDDAVLATPVALAATAGTPRHALVPDEVMRPMFAYLRALTIPTSVFAATEDWSNPTSIRTRAERAGGELSVLIKADIRHLMRAGSTDYRREFRDEDAVDDPAAGLDFSSDLMRLAAGGV